MPPRGAPAVGTDVGYKGGLGFEPWPKRKKRGLKTGKDIYGPYFVGEFE